MKKRQILAILAALGLSVSMLGGCGNPSGESAVEENVKESEAKTAEESSTADDTADNDAAEGSSESGQDAQIQGDNLPVDEAGNPSPFGKYAEPVTVEVVQSINPTIAMPEGDTVTDNYFTRAIKESTNVDIAIKWTAANSDAGEKMNLAIAANDLPDIFTANEQSFLKLAQSDMLEDLSPYYDTFACDIIKQNIDSTGGMALEKASYDGKLLGLPNVNPEADGYPLMWIRQDWLDALNLEAPTTVEELENVARAFVDNKMGGEGTVGILGPSANGRLYNTFLSINNMCNLDGIFQSFQAYPGYWVQGEDGNVVYGSTTQETKQALGELNKMFQDGILDPDRKSVV